MWPIANTFAPLSVLFEDSSNALHHSKALLQLKVYAKQLLKFL